MAQKGKKFKAAAAKVTEEFYSVVDGAALVKSIAPAAFDETVEIHVNLNLDPKHADQQLRTNTVLPHGTGKTKRVVAFVGDEFIDACKAAGAIEAGNESLVEKIEGGWTEFDVAVAHPSMMRHVGKLGRILGTKGLMPSPKSGTVTPDIVKAVTEVMGGKIEVRADATGIVHAPVGKVSFEASQLAEHISIVLRTIKDQKPSGSKGTYMESITIASTMGPAIRISTDSSVK